MDSCRLDFLALDGELSAGDAVKIVQERSEEMEMSFYLYITHGDGQLAGVISLRELLMHPPYRQLKNIMNTNVTSVTTDTDQEEVAHVISQYNILAVPVVDSSYNLVGIVTVDDIIDVIREEASEDFLRMAGAGKDTEILLKSTMANAMTRAPWLFASWIGGVMAMFIITSFHDELQKVLALAAFIPIVIGMGGNIATQSSTIIIRGIATGRVNMQELSKVIFKEMRVGLILGTVYGLFLGDPCILRVCRDTPISWPGCRDFSIFCHDHGGNGRHFCATPSKTLEFRCGNCHRAFCDNIHRYSGCPGVLPYSKVLAEPLA